VTTARRDRAAGHQARHGQGDRATGVPVAPGRWRASAAHRARSISARSIA
jgi:hypothetical protein